MIKHTIYLHIILATFIIGCSKNNDNTEHIKNDSILVKVLTVIPQKFTENGIYFGRLDPVRNVNIICYSGGRVESINVQEGDQVKAGKSLAQIDAARALALLESAKSQEVIAKSTLIQMKKHFQNGNASQLAVDQQNLAYLNAHSSYIDACKNYRGAFAITPISGVITKKFITLFEELPPNTLVFSVSLLDSLEVKIGLTERDIYKVKKGSNATLMLASVAHKKWNGKVINLAGIAGEEDRKFTAEIVFANNDFFLKPGTSGRIQIELTTFDSVIVIPTNVIIIEGIQSSVMVVDSDGLAHKQVIQTGSQSDDSTMVESGLNYGDMIITDGYQLVRNGVPVKVMNSGNQP